MNELFPLLNFPTIVTICTYIYMYVHICMKSECIRMNDNEYKWKHKLTLNSGKVSLPLIYIHPLIVRIINTIQC